MSKYKNIFAIGCTLNSFEDIFVIKKVKNVVPWTYAVEKLNDEETVGTFYDKEPHKTNKSEFKVEKLIKKKCDELYVKWEGYDNFFDRWINKKDII